MVINGNGIIMVIYNSLTIYFIYYNGSDVYFYNGLTIIV